MSMKIITVQVKTVYGKDMIYPACEESVLFAKIAGTTTLTRETIYHIRNLGYKVAVAQNTL